MARFWSGRGPSGCLEHLSRWVAAGTGLAAIVAALVSYLTLSELKEQTINAFRPELIMQGSSFRLYRTPDVNDGISTPAFFSTEAIPSTGRSTAREHSLSVTLSNVGLGAALNIQVEWEYDRKHYLERIKAMESVYCIHVVFPEAAEGGMDYILEDCKSGQAVLGYATHSTDSIDFILPHGADVEPEEVFLRKDYQDLWSIVAFQVLNSAEHPEEVIGAIKRDLSSPPPLMATVRYNDIGGNPYEKKFVIDLRVNRCSQGDELIDGSTGTRSWRGPLGGPPRSQGIFLLSPDRRGLYGIAE